MPDHKSIVLKSLAAFKKAEEESVQSISRLVQLHDQVLRQIETAKTEKAMNSAGRQTCEKLLQEFDAPPSPAPAPNGKAQEAKSAETT